MASSRTGPAAGSASSAARSSGSEAWAISGTSSGGSSNVESGSAIVSAGMACATGNPTRPRRSSSVAAVQSRRVSSLSAWRLWAGPSSGAAWSARRWLKRCSATQASSPRSSSPTMRALPLSVWKARRSNCSDSMSRGAWRQPARASPAACRTSRASSRKTSRISGSMLTAGAGAGAALSGKGSASVATSVTRPAGPSPRSRSRSRSKEGRGSDSGAAVVGAAVVGAAGAASGGAHTSCKAGRASRAAARAASRSVSGASTPREGSKRNKAFAKGACTPSMSIRKPSAPRLPAKRSKRWGAVCPAEATGASAPVARDSTSSRRCFSACEASSMPSTSKTPRIACKVAGTGCSAPRSPGLRKNWSICCSAAASEARSSCTTLPRVWRSETRAYSASIQDSIGAGAAPPRTAAMRSARRAIGRTCSGLAKSASSRAAST